jgi:hypothetical protein
MQPYVDAGDLSEDDADAKSHPEEGGDLLEVVDGRAGDGSVKEEARALDLLADEKAERGEHGDAAVGDLHVSEALRLGLVDVVVETESVDAGAEGGASLLKSEQRRKGEGLTTKRWGWGGKTPFCGVWFFWRGWIFFCMCLGYHVITLFGL